MRLFILKAFILLNVNCYSQNNYRHKFDLFPSHLLINDYVLGYEYSYANKKSIDLQVGIGTNPILIRNVFNLLHDQKMIFRLGNKFYISKNDKKFQFYHEPILSFIYSSYKYKKVKEATLYDNQPEVFLLQSSNSKSFCIDYIWGCTFFFRPQLSFDLFLGIGARYRTTDKTVFSRIPELITPQNETFPIESTKKEFLPSVVCGVKISYSFKKINK